ncbi:hypothetical protein [Halosimplex sp. J119]
MDEVGQLAKAEFESAAKQIRGLSEENFTNLFEDFFVQLLDYNPDTDAFIFQFELDKETGIDRWRMQHLDLTAEGDIFEKQKYRTQFEERDNEFNNALGISTVNFDIVQVDISPDDFQPLLLKTFEKGVEHPTPGILVTHPEGGFRVEDSDLHVTSVP